MARGDYTVQEVEALKQAERDSSYRTCVLTMFIFLALCIILLVIAWTTWKPTNEKEAYSYHSVSQTHSKFSCPLIMTDLAQWFSVILIHGPVKYHQGQIPYLSVSKSNYSSTSI